MFDNFKTNLKLRFTIFKEKISILSTKISSIFKKATPTTSSPDNDNPLNLMSPKTTLKDIYGDEYRFFSEIQGFFNLQSAILVQNQNPTNILSEDTINHLDGSFLFFITELRDQKYNRNKDLLFTTNFYKMELELAYDNFNKIRAAQSKMLEAPIQSLKYSTEDTPSIIELQRIIQFYKDSERTSIDLCAKLNAEKNKLQQCNDSLYQEKGRLSAQVACLIHEKKQLESKLHLAQQPLQPEVDKQLQAFADSYHAINTDLSEAREKDIINLERIAILEKKKLRIRKHK